MQPISGVLKTLDRELHLGWRQLRCWAERAFTKQRIAEVAIFTSTLTIIGVVLFYLIGAMQDRTIVRLFPY
jgi:hypothetical protein